MSSTTARVRQARGTASILALSTSTPRSSSNLNYRLLCPRCGSSHRADVTRNLCNCRSPLLVEYDPAGGSDHRETIGARPPGMWRYREMLPVAGPETIVSLGEGSTPLIEYQDLLIKDEGRNPTGTFKDRGASCGITKAAEMGVRDVALPTAGNAGSAWAAYGAAAGIGVHVAMPADAPAVNKLECEAYGADVTLVQGLISDAARVVDQWVTRNGWFDVSTLREPYRVEGKKTMGFEIAEQLGWEAPAAIVYPAGGGVGIIGIWLAFRQLRDRGWVEEMPRLYIVQAEGCAPLVTALSEGLEESRFWDGAATIATGLCVPKPLGDFLVLRAVRETKGGGVSVSEEEIMMAGERIGREAGLLACPEGAAAIAGAWKLREAGALSPEGPTVVINTGTGLKYREYLACLTSRDSPSET